MNHSSSRTLSLSLPPLKESVLLASAFVSRTLGTFRRTLAAFCSARRLDVPPMADEGRWLNETQRKAKRKGTRITGISILADEKEHSQVVRERLMSAYARKGADTFSR